MHHLTASWARLAVGDSSLSIEQYVSVAEMAMERGHLVGKTIEMPTGHNESPEYLAAITPIRAWVSGICGHYVNIFYSEYTMRQEGNPIAVTDGYSSICVRQRTNEMTILHECAHILCMTPEGPAGHSKQFAETARDLYARYIGPEAADVFWRNVEWAWK